MALVQDVRPWLERADVYVAALRFASGVQNKVLEAMSMKLPVVTTPVVAAGLKLDRAEPPLVVGTTAEELAAGVTRLLMSRPERAYFASEGRKYVENNCSWAASAAHLERVCLAAAQSAPAHQAA
jgi:glycosyltransferase involved in cell wall biosynthesis